MPGENGRDIIQGRTGLKGEKGQKGMPGMPGPEGYPGRSGLDGYPGLQGAKGAPGMVGLPGYKVNSFNQFFKDTTYIYVVKYGEVTYTVFMLREVKAQLEIQFRDVLVLQVLLEDLDCQEFMEIGDDQEM